MDIVVLTTVLPASRRTGGEVVTDGFVRAMRDAGHAVTVVGYERPGERSREPDAVAVGSRPIETAGAPRRLLARWAIAALFRRVPYSVAKYRSRAYRDAARAAIVRADLVVIDHAQSGWLLDEVPASTPVVLLAHNVEHRLYAEQAGTSRGARRRLNHREERLMRALERRLVERAEEVWALTVDDASMLAQLGPSIPVCVFAVPGQSAVPAAQKTVDVAVLGTWSWAANAEGLHWFCDDVVPRLPPTCRVEIAGAGGEWSAATPGVTYRGRVPDAGAFLASARVVAIPSTAGSGVQVKTLDALASGAWVVATPVAVRGIDGAGPVMTVADSPAAFADAVARLVHDERTLGPCAAALAWSEPRARVFRAAVAEALARVRAP